MGVQRLTQEEADDWKRGGAALWQPCGADSHWLNRGDCTITTQDRIPAAEESDKLYLKLYKALPF